MNNELNNKLNYNESNNDKNDEDTVSEKAGGEEAEREDAEREDPGKEEPKKTRGRKKKVIQENYEIKNEQDIETLQIEQVKKKRGRKKKWEVETTTKLIQNGPISFSENNNKTESPQINDNYESQSISFGNLNIKVHSNKDNIQVDDIKQSLKQNNSNKNNKKQENTLSNTNNTNDIKCKIDLTNSDFDDSDCDDNNNSGNNFNNNGNNCNNVNSNSTQKKYTRKPQHKIAEKNMKIMKYYTDEFDIGNEILISRCRCYYCHHNFNNKPFFLPIDYSPELDRFKVTGNFCSPNCVKTFAINSKLHSQKSYLIGFMYRKLFGANYIIKPAPPIQCLKEYGGKLTIEEFRETFDNNKNYSLKNICSKVITDEIINK